MVQGGGSLAGGTNRAGADGGWGSGTGEIKRGSIKMKPLPLRLVRVNPVYCVAARLHKSGVEECRTGTVSMCVFTRCFGIAARLDLGHFSLLFSFKSVAHTL